MYLLFGYTNSQIIVETHWTRKKNLFNGTTYIISTNNNPWTKFAPASYIIRLCTLMLYYSNISRAPKIVAGVISEHISL